MNSLTFFVVDEVRSFIVKKKKVLNNSLTFTSCCFLKMSVALEYQGVYWLPDKKV